MFAITWQIAIFLLCTVVTLILERAMSNVPEVVWRATYSALLLGLVIKTLLSQPVYEYVRNPRAHQVISLMLIVAACGIIFGTIWCFFVIGFPSSEAYVSTRIKSQLAKWIPPVNFTLLPDDPKAYFRYQITFGDGISIYAVRKKNEGSLKLQAVLKIGQWELDTYNHLSEAEKGRFWTEFRSKLAAAKISAESDHPNFTKLTFTKGLVINELTEPYFKDKLDNIHLDVTFAHETVRLQLQQVLKDRESFDVTPENVEARIKEWAKGYKSIGPLPEADPNCYFGYTIRYHDDQPMNLYRYKTLDNCITFQVKLPLDSFQPAIDNLSPEALSSFLTELEGELGKVKDFYEFDPVRTKVFIIKFIPITSLTKASFERAMYQIHKDGARIVDVIKEALKRRQSPTH